ncbi:acireductone synthase [Methylosarcina fibrata]|uniref:acireductone synthase n=1 Tax=Methylosarcina fibrata TaxID=105972 RepID=UPI0003797932|nr:acireductone synthase [Methylosarcina fibrata]
MIKAIVTDIEGTTTSLSFVKEVLFPYARAHLAEFVREHAGDAEVRRQLDEVRREIQARSRDEVTMEQVISQLIEWLDEDKKITPLKILQGMIWEEGYARGAFHGHLYPDAMDNLKAWKARGLELYVYSSGSVQAQKLLFSHTEQGDLTPLFSGYFDTRIGGKKEIESYRKIAGQLDREPDTILFLSDSKEELDAAGAAGFHTICLARGDAPDSQAEHREVRNFDEIRLSL